MATPEMPDFAMAELDLRVVNALQLNPRASWLQVGRALGVDPSTVQRRWRRLHEAGAAWVSCQPLATADPGVAFVEIDVEPGRVYDVADELARDPEAMTIDLAAGGRDLLVTVACADAHALADYLLERMVRVPHVRRVQSHVVVTPYAEASRWRLRALTAQQEETLRGTVPDLPAEARPAVLDGRDRALVAALSADGRTPLRELAGAVGASESTVRRRLGTLLATRQVRLRCELARELTQWPVSEWFLARVPSDRLDEAARSLSGVPEVRAVLSAAGPFNLLIAVWLPSVVHGQRLETQVMRRLPHVEIVDRSVVIRPFKLAGRLLDVRGFAVGVVPLAAR